MGATATATATAVRRGGAAVALAVGAASLLVACGSGDGGGGADTGARAPSVPSRTTAPSASPSPSPSLAAPSPTHTPSAAPTRKATDTAGCYDGTCRVTVTGPTTIRVDPHRFGFSSFRVTRISSSGVTVAASGAGTHLESGVSPGGTAGLNGLRVKVLSASGGAADLQLTH